jgi:hypothetical protein
MAKNNAFKIKEITKKEKEGKNPSIYKNLNNYRQKICPIHNTYIYH